MTGPARAGAPKVFVSYRHDDAAHRARVLELCKRLRRTGVEAELDQGVPGTPDEGWPLWMLEKLKWADFVLVVCTRGYHRSFLCLEGAGVGRGVRWEARIIAQQMYDDPDRIHRFIPVLFDRSDSDFVPEPLRVHTRYLVNGDESFLALVEHLHGRSGVRLGPVESAPPAPEASTSLEVPGARARRERRFAPRKNLASTGVLVVAGLAVVGAVLAAMHRWVDDRSGLSLGVTLVLVVWALERAIVRWASAAVVSVGDGGIELGYRQTPWSSRVVPRWRIPWHHVDVISYEKSPHAIVVHGRDEDRFAVVVRIGVTVNPDAAAWVVREGRRRVPDVVRVGEDVWLPAADPYAGEELLLPSSPPMLRATCATCMKPVKSVSDARMCPRCERTYHAEHAPVACACVNR